MLVPKEKHTDRKLELKTVLLELIDPPTCARPLDQEHVQRLAESIDEFGLFQRPGVVAEGDRYRTAWGNSRIHALGKLGRTDCDVAVLPQGTSPADEMYYSIQENELRVQEHFLDLLVRIDATAKFAGCSPTKVAEENGVSGSRLSRIRKLDAALSDEIKAIARKHDVGVSVLYEIAQVDDAILQRSYLDRYIQGDLNRDQIAEAARLAKGKRPTKQKTIEFDLSFEGVPFGLSLPEGCTYEQFEALFKLVQKRFKHYQKEDIDLEFLPGIFAKQRSG